MVTRPTEPGGPANPSPDGDSLTGLLPGLDGEPGPAEPLGPAATDAMVAAALAGWAAAPGPGTYGAPDPQRQTPASSPGAAGWRTPGKLLGLGALAVLGATLAGWLAWQASSSSSSSSPPHAPSSAAAPQDPGAPAGPETGGRAAAAAGARSPEAAALAPARSAKSQAWFDRDGLPGGQDGLRARDPGDRRPGASAAGSTAETRGPAGPDAAAPGERRGGRTSAPAQDLLARANRLRAEGRFADAAATYHRAARAGRGTFTAYVATVAAADLELDHLGDPRGAAAGYRAARKAVPGGPLEVEALAGLARAVARLGQRDDERNALRALLAADPPRGLADQARARLDALSAGDGQPPLQPPPASAPSSPGAAADPR